MGDNSFATGYALGADSSENRNCNNGGFGMDGGWAWIWIILIFAIFGWNNGGWGGNNGGGANMYYPFASMQGLATRADINEGFALNNITSGITGIQQGICDSTYALNNAITNGFSAAELGRCNSQAALTQQLSTNQAALTQQLNTMSFQNQQCCCETQRQIERGFCDVGYAMATNTANIIQASHGDTDRVLAKLSDMESARQAEKIAALQAENQSLKFSASQDRQNALLTTAMTAQTTQILGTLNPAPVPSYQVPNPYTGRYAYQSGCGCNTGCGCFGVA